MVILFLDKVTVYMALLAVLIVVQVCQSLVIKTDKEIQYYCHRWVTGIRLLFTTKVNPLLNVRFILLFCPI